jgi:chromosome partitioning protein
MKVLAILSQKGGVGKTTLATCLAVAAEADGKAAVVLDLDPQATATFWRDNREAETPAVSSLQASRLAVTLQAAAKGGADLAIIDGAAVAREVAYMAAQHADFVLIPTKSAVFDTMSMTHTLDVVNQLNKPAAVVLTFVSPQGKRRRTPSMPWASWASTFARPPSAIARHSSARKSKAGPPRNMSPTEQRLARSQLYMNICI